MLRQVKVYYDYSVSRFIVHDQDKSYSIAELSLENVIFDHPYILGNISKKRVIFGYNVELSLNSFICGMNKIKTSNLITLSKIDGYAPKIVTIAE